MPSPKKKPLNFSYVLQSFSLTLFPRPYSMHDSHMQRPRIFHMTKVCCWIMLASLIVYVQPFLLHFSAFFLFLCRNFERERKQNIYSRFFRGERKKKNFKNRRRNERIDIFSFGGGRHDVHDFWYSFLLVHHRFFPRQTIFFTRMALQFS